MSNDGKITEGNPVGMDKLKKAINDINQNGLEPPYLMNMGKKYGIKNVSQQREVLGKSIYGKEVELNFGPLHDEVYVTDTNGDKLYYENIHGKYKEIEKPSTNEMSDKNEGMKSSNLNESTEVKKIKDLMNRINLI